jgi:hypothetical protein
MVDEEFSEKHRFWQQPLDESNFEESLVQWKVLSIPLEQRIQECHIEDSKE